MEGLFWASETADVMSINGKSSGLACLESLEDETLDLGTEGAFLRIGRIQGSRGILGSGDSCRRDVSSGT